MFRRGYGCFGCFGECSDPVLAERRSERLVWSAHLHPFDEAAARRAFAVVKPELRRCALGRGLAPFPLVVEIDPTGRVRRLFPMGEAERARGCFVGWLEGVTVAPFAGTSRTLVVPLF